MLWGRQNDRATVRVITAGELERRLAQAKPPLVVDVRESWEWQAGHIPGAVLIPLGTLPTRVHELPADRDIVAVCRSGHRSRRAALWLEERGFSVHNLHGGYLTWKGPLEAHSERGKTRR